MKFLQRSNIYVRDFNAQQNAPSRLATNIWQKLHLDPMLLGALSLLIIIGLFVLYSAGGESMELLIQQGIRLLLAFVVMLIFAQIPPHKYHKWTPWIFTLGIFLLIAVLIIGHIGKGAQRWLNIGVVKFQPSEMMKLAVPMMMAWYLHERSLPPSFLAIIVCSLMTVIPAGLTAVQPDLGTAIIIASAGPCLLFLAGMRFRFIITLLILLTAGAPVLWNFFMHDYQRDRVLTFINPERDPLGSGYHIIQSKIAIGSGGIFGKGWLNGTQSHLQYLPEHATDFIFAVLSEEFGLIGTLIVLTLFVIVVMRGLYISTQAQDTYSRLLTGSISLMFFISFFVNIGMVSGALPVVGLPLPLISYGGTSMVTIMAGFGIIMSIHSHRKLVST